MNLLSCPCTYNQLINKEFQEWCVALKDNTNHAHRKLWEWSFICQALHERNMIRTGRTGLGFAVGQEPLVSLFAKYGCVVTATDLDLSENSDSTWIKTNQHSDKLDDLNKRNICDENIFKEKVKFEFADMNKIQPNLQGYDFCWSSCAFEHLGSIKKGKEFLYNSINCIKPGGISVHTTEFNISSNTTTVDNHCDVLFRKCDFEEIAEELKSRGHEIILDFTLGDTEFDLNVDKPPYTHNPHIRFQYGSYVSTSYGLIIKKKEPVYKKIFNFISGGDRL